MTRLQVLRSNSDGKVAGKNTALVRIIHPLAQRPTQRVNVEALMALI